MVCSQGGLIPPLLALLDGGPAVSYRTAKGAGWILSFADAPAKTGATAKTGAAARLAALDVLP